MRAGRALLAPLAAIAFLSVLAAPASASIQFDQQWGSLGILNGQFSLPNRVATDSSGSVYATDTGNSRVEKFSSLGAFIAKWGAVGTGDGQFLSEQGIATDTAGNVYVVDGQANRIQKFSSSGTFTTKWGSLGAGNGQFTAPQGIATDSSDNVYVTDQDNDRIQKFDSSGAFITKWGSLGTGNGQFSAPAGVATDSSGNVYVADAGNTRIQKFSSSGNFITKWGSLGTGDGQFGASTTLDVATGSAGNVLVADSSNNRIEKFRPSGTFITKWGSLGTGAGQFTSPTGVATDPSDNVYVLDRGNSRIEKFHETDATAPDTAIDSGPSGVSNADVSFTFSSPEPQLLGFECRPRLLGLCELHLSQGLLEPPRGIPHLRGEGGRLRRKPRSEPRLAHLDGGSNGTPRPRSTPAPPGRPTTPSPSFGFSSEAGASFECRLDSSQEADFQPCSSPKPYSSLPDGSHTFEVRATDSVGNTDPTPACAASRSTPSAPETQIDSGPSGPTNDASPSFSFSSEAGASFECRLDSSQEADFQPCSSPKPYGSLPDGSHTFEVRATDSAGNTDPTPASRGFTVDTVRPPDPDQLRPLRADQGRHAVLRLLLRAGASFQCKLDWRRLCSLQLAEDLQPPARRPPHLPGPRHRCGRQHRPHPGRAELHRRHRAAQHGDNRRSERRAEPARDRRPHPDLHLLLLGGGLEL